MKRITLTLDEAVSLFDAARAAEHLHREFLMHDDWDYEQDQEFIDRVQSNKDNYVECVKILREKIAKAVDK